MPTTQVGAVVIATLNGAVPMSTIIDNGANGWTTNATNNTTVDGDVMEIVGKNGVTQRFVAKAQTATALKVVPLEPMVTQVAFADKSPIYLVASKLAV